MARHSAIPHESFEDILAWFHSDREVAAAIYLQVREDLARLFIWAECGDPEGLTDEAFDRVAKKVREVRPTYEGDPKNYFVGVARNLIKEDSKKVKRQVPIENIDPVAKETLAAEAETADMRHACLHHCLKRLSAEERELIVRYYEKEKQAKIEHRAELARRLGISLGTLRVRAYRLRVTLEQCIEECLDRQVQK